MRADRRLPHPLATPPRHASKEQSPPRHRDDADGRRERRRSRLIAMTLVLASGSHVVKPALPGLVLMSTRTTARSGYSSICKDRRAADRRRCKPSWVVGAGLTSNKAAHETSIPSDMKRHEVKNYKHPSK